MKKMLAFALSAVMALSLAACGSNGKPEENSLEIPNPFTECETMDEAAKLAGFGLCAPDAVDGQEKTAIRVLTEGGLVEVIYGSGDDRAVIRKAAGSEDISGDYTEYAESNTVAVGEIQVTMQGGNGQVRLAAWTNDGYTYSIGVYAETGVSSDMMADLVAAVQ